MGCSRHKQYDLLQNNTCTLDAATHAPTRRCHPAVHAMHLRWRLVAAPCSVAVRASRRAAARHRAYTARGACHRLRWRAARRAALCTLDRHRLQAPPPRQGVQPARIFCRTEPTGAPAAAARLSRRSATAAVCMRSLVQRTSHPRPSSPRTTGPRATRRRAPPPPRPHGPVWEAVAVARGAAVALSAKLFRPDCIIMRFNAASSTCAIPRT